MSEIPIVSFTYYYPVDLRLTKNVFSFDGFPYLAVLIMFSGFTLKTIETVFVHKLLNVANLCTKDGECSSSVT